MKQLQQPPAVPYHAIAVDIKPYYCFKTMTLHLIVACRALHLTVSSCFAQSQKRFVVRSAGVSRALQQQGQLLTRLRDLNIWLPTSAGCFAASMESKKEHRLCNTLAERQLPRHSGHCPESWQLFGHEGAQ